MKIVFRVDASIQIGSGHVMRCLTLANALREYGCECYFICRKHNGNLIEYIKEKKYCIFPLETNPAFKIEEKDEIFHGKWLGETQEQDALLCLSIIQNIQPDWVIVDHYAISEKWEKIIKPFTGKIMVIDDLADRKHIANILLDQNLGRTQGDYQNLVLQNCQLLIGPRYALLRPEFTQWRSYSLQRRKIPQLKSILINLGGVDKHNITRQILEVFKKINIDKGMKLIVIMGITAPWLDDIKQLAVEIPYQTEVKTNVINIAEIMSNCDLAIGAAGSTTWERCCLGLPSITLVLAENQKDILKFLQNNNAALTISDVNQLADCLKSITLNKLTDLSSASSKVCNGYGVFSVISSMIDDGILREMTENDLAEVFSWRNHPAVRKWMFNSDEINFENHKKWFYNSVQNENKKLLIFEKNNSAYGFVQFDKVGNGCIYEWGFYISPNSPKGIGSQMGFKAIDYVFKILLADKLVGKVLDFNQKSINFHKKLGFVEEGYLRQHFYNGDSYSDIYQFGLLKKEWEIKNKGKS